MARIYRSTTMEEKGDFPLATPESTVRIRIEVTAQFFFLPALLATRTWLCSRPPPPLGRVSRGSDVPLGCLAAGCLGAAKTGGGTK